MNEAYMDGQSRPLRWPSVVYGLMGFLAFALGVRLAMPRVATTMLALLSLTSLRNQVIALLPISDEALGRYRVLAPSSYHY